MSAKMDPVSSFLLPPPHHVEALVFAWCPASCIDPREFGTTQRSLLGLAKVIGEEAGAEEEQVKHVRETASAGTRFLGYREECLAFPSMAKAEGTTEVLYNHPCGESEGH